MYFYNILIVLLIVIVKRTRVFDKHFSRTKLVKISTYTICTEPRNRKLKYKYLDYFYRPPQLQSVLIDIILCIQARYYTIAVVKLATLVLLYS